MKTVALLFLLLPAGLFGQSIRIMDKAGNTVNGDTIDVVFHPGPDHGWTEIVLELHVKNVGTGVIYLGAKKTEFNMQRDEYHSICFGGMCFDSTVYVSPFPFIPQVAPGGVDSSFSGHYRFDDLTHAKHECLVAYTFYNDSNRNDSATVYVNYNTLLQLNGVKEQTTPVRNFSVWPNPATQVIHVSFDGATQENATLEISNSLGECVGRVTMSGLESSIDVQHLAAGLYYIGIVSNNTSPLWRKVIIGK